MSGHTIQEPPVRTPAPEDCYFYHTMEVPGHGLMLGQWDLRAGVDDYLGHVDMAGARVLEIGPASGFLTFYMESRGAAVTACELASFDQWDIVPYADANLKPYVEDRLELGRRLRNGFWLAHAAHRSRVRLGLCSAYDIPSNYGPFDIATFGSVLVHVRDPFLALESAARHTERAIIVTDRISGMELSAASQDLVRPRPAKAAVRADPSDLTAVVGAELAAMPPKMQFIPRFAEAHPKDSWWQMGPILIREFLGILGFTKQSVGYHYQVYDPKYRWADPAAESEPVYLALFSVVGER
jgi:hypothetical protein